MDFRVGGRAEEAVLLGPEEHNAVAAVVGRQAEHLDDAHHYAWVVGLAGVCFQTCGQVVGQGDPGQTVVQQKHIGLSVFPVPAFLLCHHRADQHECAAVPLHPLYLRALFRRYDSG